LPNKLYTGHQTRSQRKRKTKEHPEKRLGESYVDSRFQTQLEEDEGESTGQSWMDI